MGDGFRWNEWNLWHVARHGVDPEQAEYVVLHARRPYPSYEGDGRWLVAGKTTMGGICRSPMCSILTATRYT